LLFLEVLKVKKSKITLLGRLVFSFILIKAYLYIVWAVPVHAAFEKDAEVSVAVQGTYDDNVQFTGDDDYVLKISPSAALSAVTEETQVQLGADLDIREYKKNGKLSSVDQYYQVLGGADLAEKRVELDLVGTYIRDHTFQSELEETGIVLSQTERSRAAIRPTGTFWLAPRDRMQLTYEYGDTSFSSDQRRDYTYHFLRVSWLHDLRNERTTLGFLVGANRTEYGDNIDNPNEDLTYQGVGAGVQLDHLFSETFIINLKAGGTYNQSKTRGPGDDDRSSNTNFVGEASVRWIFERSTLSALVNQQVVPSSAGEDVARTKANLGLGYRLSENFRCNLSGYYRRSDPLNGGQTVQTFGGQAKFAYAFTENLGLSLAYSYTKTDQDSDNIIDDNRNRVFLELRWFIHRPEWRVKPPRELVKWPHRL
jgi:hypothetical protein